MAQKIFIFGGNSYLAYELTFFLAKKHKFNDIYSVSRSKNNFYDNNVLHLDTSEFFKDNNRVEDAIVYYFISLDRSECQISKSSIDVNLGLFTKTISKFSNSKIIYLSTFSVYRDDWDFDTITENSPISFSHPYGMSHYQCEVVGRDLSVRCNNLFVPVRLTNAFGWKERFFAERYVLNSLIYSAFSNNEVELKSDGNFVRDFIYITDVLSILELFISDNYVYTLGSINICSQKSYLIRDVAMLVQKLSEIELNTKIGLSISGSSFDLNPDFSISPVVNSVVKSIVFDRIGSEFKSIEDGITLALKFLKSTNPK